MLIKENSEVYYTANKMKPVGRSDFEFLKAEALKNSRSRCRLCTHASPASTLHEMFILHTKDNYVPPHSHLNSDESVFVCEGEGAMIYFDADGAMSNTIYLSADTNKGFNYIRTPVGQIHSLYIHSSTLLFKETIGGPFNSANSVLPKWAPKEDDLKGVDTFMQNSEKLYLAVREKNNVIKF